MRLSSCQSIYTAFGLYRKKTPTLVLVGGSSKPTFPVLFQKLSGDRKIEKNATNVEYGWEHLIRDEDDYSRHIDYIHWNPVKHGWVKQVKAWPYSSFYKHVDRGIYPLDWAGEIDDSMGYGE